MSNIFSQRWRHNLTRAYRIKATIMYPKKKKKIQNSHELIMWWPFNACPQRLTFNFGFRKSCVGRILEAEIRQLYKVNMLPLSAQFIIYTRHLVGHFEGPFSNPPLQLKKNTCRDAGKVNQYVHCHFVWVRIDF